MTNKLFTDDDLDDDLIEETVEIPEDNPLAPFMEKYHDEKGLAKAIVEKESFIQRLKRENAELRGEVTARSRVEDVVDKLLQTRPQNTQSNSGAQIPDENSNENGSQITKGLTEDDVKRIMEHERAAAKAELNVKVTKDKLQELYGANWQKVLIAKGKELGESAEFFDALARKNPNAVIALVANTQMEKKPAGATLFNDGVNTTATALQQTNSAARNQAYYSKLKAADPKRYWTPAVQNQMHKDALAQGPSFFT